MRPHPNAKGNLYQRQLFIERVLDEGLSVAEASIQIGDDQTRSRSVAGTRGSGSRPRRRAS